jgi:hypothetical protein
MSRKKSNWNPNEKPDLTVCPQQFCWFWLEEEELFASSLHSSVDEAWENLQVVEKVGCGCAFGPCRRETGNPGHEDWYEPCEPELAKHGLPWFYFADPRNLRRKRQKGL